MATNNTDVLFQSFRTRGIAVLFDDLAPQGNAVLLAAADQISEETLNEIFHFSGGLPFVAISPKRADAFILNSMRDGLIKESHIQSEIDACISVEAREGVTTGISIADRATTIRILGEKEPNPRKLVKPGHIFPVKVREGGVLMKNALPEGALDLVKITGNTDAALYVDLLGESGNFLNFKQTMEFCSDNNVPLFNLSDLTRYRLENEKLVERVAETKLPTEDAGELKAYVYKSPIHDGEHLAFVKGEVTPEKPILIRVQPEFTFGDVLAETLPISCTIS